MKPFQYSPLREDRSEFRLVRLWPGPASAEIEIEIFHAARSSSYEALSYAWGNPERTNEAIVRTSIEWNEESESLSKLSEDVKLPTGSEPSLSSTTIGITHNLAIALTHLRYEKSPRVLWIDALCINQDDLLERSVEVLDMGSIYTCAQQVVVWIGPSSDDSGLAMTTLRAIGEGIYFNKDDQFIYRPNSLAQSLENDLEALKAKEPNWFAIKDLLRREWFSRLWVLQEVGLATSATMYVGQHSTDWKVFITALEWLWNTLVHLNQVIPNLGIPDFADSTILAFIIMSRVVRLRRYPSLKDCLILTCKMACSDPRDRLYAMRHLVKSSERNSIIPDYSSSVEEAFQDTFLRACRARSDGYLLDLCLLQGTPSKLQLPSWVPDFSASSRPQEFYNPNASGNSSFYHVGANESLAIQAVKVASITSLLSPLKPSYTNLEVIQACKSLMISCASGTYVGGGSTFNAFVDALLLGERAGMYPDSHHIQYSPEQCRMILEGPGTAIDEQERDSDELYLVSGVRLALRSRAFFRTEEGFFGFCPESTNPGDLVVVVLGLSSPLVVRSVQHSGKSCYRVVGPCYMPGAMHTECLLGQLPVGWNVIYRELHAGIFQLFTQADTITQEDPRVPLPPPWRYRYGSFEQFHETEPSGLNTFLPQFFENVETKEKTRFDPRLTPEALRDRGVDIRELVLV